MFEQKMNMSVPGNVTQHSKGIEEVWNEKVSLRINRGFISIKNSKRIKEV